MPTMTWQYVAGFFDGEGCICTVTMVNKNYTQGGLSWRCAITQCYRPVLEEIREFLLSKGITSTISVHGPYESIVKAKKKIHTLVITGGRDGVFAFLTGCFPFLRVKKTLSQDVMRTMILCPPLRGLTKVPKRWNEKERAIFSQIRKDFWTPERREEQKARITKWWADRKVYSCNTHAAGE